MTPTRADRAEHELFARVEADCKRRAGVACGRLANEVQRCADVRALTRAHPALLTAAAAAIGFFGVIVARRIARAERAPARQRSARGSVAQSAGSGLARRAGLWFFRVVIKGYAIPLLVARFAAHVPVAGQDPAASPDAGDPAPGAAAVPSGG